MSALLEVIHRLAEHPNRRPRRDHVQAAAREILSGKASTAQLASFLTGLRIVGETAAEIDAFVEVMLDHATAFPRPDDDEPIVDTCGTGGDGLQTFNISTAAALVVAAAGVRVAKHGNRSASSRCGSADVLEALGYRIERTPEEAAADLTKHNFCFLFARSYHPAMKHAAAARQELKMRTIFNICGPLSNPARPTHQLVGVSSPDLVEPVALALRSLGLRGALVVHGADGMDEISLSQVTEGVRLNSRGNLESWHISPIDLDIKPVEMAELVGGDAEENARLLKAVLEGEKGPRADAVIMNAAGALWIAGAEPDYKRAFGLAREVQRSGKAAKLMESLAADR